MESREARPQDLHVVGQFRHSADGRTRGLDGVALLNCDGRRDAFDAVDLRLVHAVEELPRVRGKRFDVSALAFGEKSVNGEGDFSGAAEASNDDQLARGQVQIEIFKVIVPDAAEADGRRKGFSRHRS